MERQKLEALNQFVDQAWETAHRLGLKPVDVEFEIVPATAIFELASYGVPGHWHHWTYGREYWLIKQRMEEGAGRLYELVVNTDPARAYLLESNSIAAQKLVIAHVLGHADLFRNHEWFLNTPKDMDRSMAAAQERFDEYAAAVGTDRLETCLDRALSLRDQVAEDPPLPEGPDRPADPYADLFRSREAGPVRRRTAPRYRLPTGDVLGFLARHSPVLEDWERDVLETVRREAIYFAPQRVTKLVHEGYATWVHRRLLDDLALSQAEALEATRIHAQVVAPHPLTVNPYRLGFQLLDYLAERHGFGGMRAIALQETDASLVRNWLDADAVRYCQLFRYEWKAAEHVAAGHRAPTWDAVVQDAEVERLRTLLANRLAYRGPEILVTGVDGAGRLILRHVPDEWLLDEAWARATLQNVATLWGAPAVLEREGAKPLTAQPAS
jgi:stage V sporulation protein R